MRHKPPRLRHAAYVAAISCLVGCQNGLTPTGGLPTLGRSAKEARIERQAENDPFPTPADVGLK